MVFKRNKKSTREVQAGCTVMDAVYPGWAQYVDAQTVDLSDSHLCVLGQIARYDPRARQDQKASGVMSFEFGTLSSVLALGYLQGGRSVKLQMALKELDTHWFGSAECGFIGKRDHEDSWIREIKARQKALSKKNPLDDLLAKARPTSELYKLAA